ncbi:MAG: YqeG family HAD IIIA-type phosphatase [Lachnospiraceae bacterium]|nr:YqeG family HAD IIIA-type phosphatase [Lachnospiraceae bacterium]
MLQIFYPGSYVDSAYEIDYATLYEKGYRGIIYDVDNTLVEHGAPANARAVALFEKLRSIGFDTVVLSNNREERVKPFCDAVGTKYLYKAWKPKKEGYMLAMERMGTDPESTLFIGDQLFTDVWGANRCRIRTILVKPIHPKEEIQIILKRIPEKWILFFYKRRMKKQHGL